MESLLVICALILAVQIAGIYRVEKYRKTSEKAMTRMNFIWAKVTEQGRLIEELRAMIIAHLKDHDPKK